MAGIRDKPGREGTRYRSAAFELDARRLLLLQNGQVVDVEPKPLEVLAELMIHAGELVTKAELLDSVWAGRSLTEGVITRCINRLRAVLGDTDQTLILTVHGYGYRYTGKVEVLTDPETPVATNKPPDLRADAEPPLRPSWRLRRQLDASADVWLAEQIRTGEQRVMKFAATVTGVTCLKRELTIMRLLRKALGERSDFIRLLDYNLEAAPYFLELEYHELGSFGDWLASAEGRQTSLEKRLAMVAQAAAALADAHAVGVLHQDIKPGNLLLRRNQAGELSLCWSDFGIGGVDRAQLDQYQLTAIGMTGCSDGFSGGTISYIAPERLAGAAATIRGDIYSLGVLLYQVCVGDIARTFAPGWERDIPDELLRDDIAACADIDPARRLGDAAELAQRLRSRESRRVAQAQQLAERQRLLLAEQALERGLQRRRWMRLVVAALVIGAVASTWQWWRAERAENDMRAALTEATAVNDFINDEVFSAADPYLEGGGPNITVASVLEAASKKLDEHTELGPAAAARLGVTLGSSFYDLGLLPQAHARLSRSLRLSEQQLGPDADPTNELRMRFGEVLWELDQLQEAGRIYAAVGESAARLGPDKGHVWGQRSRTGLGWIAHLRGEYSESARILEPLIAELEAEPSPRLESLANARWNLSETYIELNRYAEARQLVGRAQAHFAKTVGENNALIDWVRETEVMLLLAEGRPAEALSQASDISRRARVQLSSQHWSAQFADYQMGVAYLQLGQLHDAEKSLTPALALRQKTYGDRHLTTLMVANALVATKLRLGDIDGALSLSRQTDQLSQSVFGAKHPRSLAIALNLGVALAAQGGFQQARSVLAAAISNADTALPSDHRLRAELRAALGRIAQSDHRPEEAQRLYTDALRIFDAGLGAEHPRTREVRAAASSGRLPQVTAW